MDGSGAYYASRSELLEWLNSVLPEPASVQLRVTKVEHCKSGIPYAILLAEIYPNLRNVISKRLKGASVGIVSMIATGNPNDASFGIQKDVSEYDSHHNMKMIQDILTKNHISRLVEVDRIAKGHFPSNLEFLQWFRKFSTDFGIQPQYYEEEENAQEDHHQQQHDEEDQIVEADEMRGGHTNNRSHHHQTQQHGSRHHAPHIDDSVSPLPAVESNLTTSRSIASSAGNTSSISTAGGVATSAGANNNNSAAAAASHRRAGAAATAHQQPQQRSVSGSRLKQMAPSRAAPSNTTTNNRAQSPRGANNNGSLNASVNSSGYGNGPMQRSNSLGRGSNGGGGPSVSSPSAVRTSSARGRATAVAGHSTSTTVIAQQRSSSAKRTGTLGGGDLSPDRPTAAPVGFRQSGGVSTARSQASSRGGAMTPTSSARGPATTMQAHGGAAGSPSTFTRTQGQTTLTNSPQAPQPHHADPHHHHDDTTEGRHGNTNNNVGSGGGIRRGSDAFEDYTTVAHPAAPTPMSASALDTSMTPRTRSALTSADLRNLRNAVVGGSNSGGGGLHSPTAMGSSSGGGVTPMSAANAAQLASPVRNPQPTAPATANFSLKNAAPRFPSTSSPNAREVVHADSSTTSAANVLMADSAASANASSSIDYQRLSPQTQDHLLAQYEGRMSQAEGERDFYYDKLRMIEALVAKETQALKNSNNSSSGLSPARGGAGGAGGPAGRRPSSISLGRSQSPSAAANGGGGNEVALRLLENIRSILLSADNEL